jgi:hypothetical protein
MAACCGLAELSAYLVPLGRLDCVRSQAKDSRKAKVEQSEFDEELSEPEGRLCL